MSLFSDLHAKGVHYISAFQSHLKSLPDISNADSTFGDKVPLIPIILVRLVWYTLTEKCVWGLLVNLTQGSHQQDLLGQDQLTLFVKKMEHILTDSVPSECFSNSGLKIWKAFLVGKCGQAIPTDNNIQLFLNLLLDIWIQYHGKHEPRQHSRSCFSSSSTVYSG